MIGRKYVVLQEFGLVSGFVGRVGDLGVAKY